MENVWALGDYDRFARALVWDVGPVVVRAAGVGPGMRVLDVAAGTGNVAIRAAEAGADVVACDLTPENLAAGRRHAASIEWAEGDAQALPFADAEFDVVTSAFGAMFPPDQRAVAAELVRVCRPGGTIALASFVPDGTAGDFFSTLGRHMPPGPNPLLWGTESHVRELLGDRVASLHATREAYVERADGGPEAYVAFYQETFGPLIALRTPALDHDFLAFAERANNGPPGGPAEYRYEYLLVVARRGPA